MTSEIATLRKLLNESLDVLEAENKLAGNPPFTLDPIEHPIDETDSKVVSPRFYLARRAAIGAMQQLTGLIQPVADKITTDSIACLQTAAVAAISRSGIFIILAGKDVDVKKGLHVDEIQKRVAEEKRFSDKNLPRFLRLAAALGWLKETSPDVFALTRPALCLGTHPGAAAFFDSLALQNMRATPAFYENATDPKTRASESAAEAAWSRGMKAFLEPGQNIWQYMAAKAPHEMQQFGLGMSYGVGTTAAVIADYPWEKLNGTVVDIGGGRGSLSLPMLRKNPNLKLIIQDRPEVAELAKANIAENWSHYGDRVTAEPHDFFDKQPHSGEGINYMMRWILHDWSDTDCIKILSAISSVMHKDSKIVVVDAIVTPGPGTNTVEGFLEALKKADNEHFSLVEPPAPLSKAFDDAKTLRSLDMLMGSWFNARERTQEQFATIADAAGLKINKVYPARACHWVTEYIKK